MSYSFFDADLPEHRRWRLSFFDDGPALDVLDNPSVPTPPRGKASESSLRREPISLVEALPGMASNAQLLGIEEHGLLRHHVLRAATHEELLGMGSAPARVGCLRNKSSKS